MGSKEGEQAKTAHTIMVLASVQQSWIDCDDVKSSDMLSCCSAVNASGGTLSMEQHIKNWIIVTAKTSFSCCTRRPMKWIT